MTDKNVFQLISAVMKDLSEVGISKNQKNTFDNYVFRGIDDVYNTLSKILSKHGLLIMPNIINQHTTQVQTQKGGVMNHTTLQVIYTFISAHDGTTHRLKMRGEALDRGDKSINKAFTAAYKYLCLQVFCIPLQGNEDADSESHVIDQRPMEKTGNKVLDRAINDYVTQLNQCANIDDLKATYKTLYKYAEESGATQDQLDILEMQKDNKKEQLSVNQ